MIFPDKLGAGQMILEVSKRSRIELGNRFARNGRSRNGLRRIRLERKTEMNARLRLRLLVQLYGILLFVIGLFGMSTLTRLPRGHPGLGGPDPVKVILAIVGFPAMILVLGIPFVWLCWCRHFFPELLYTIPSLVLLAYLARMFLPALGQS